MMRVNFYRSIKGFFYTLAVIPLITVVAGYSVVQAQIAHQVTVTAVVPEQPPFGEPDTTVIFRGISYPSSTLTIQEDGIVVVQLTTDTQAGFDVSIIVVPGTHTYTVFGSDQQGLVGIESNFTLTLSVGSTTTISGIFLGPTITIDETSIAAGETTTVTGTTVPNSQVNVTLNGTGTAAAAGGPRAAVVIANADTNGRWLQLFHADDLAVGSYTARAQAVEPVNSSVSEFSKSVAFAVTSSGTPDQCASSVIADINCDGSVNLVDFSILLFYWEQSNPSNVRADINRDTTVNIIDFSIMMFYWTG